jgi:predicted PurR-regulated permease PerM
MIPAGNVANNLLMAVLVIAGLYFAREILVPVALAVLISFVLTPLVGFLQRWRFPRAAAISVTVVVALAVVAGLAGMVISQVNSLAADLPKYQATLREKVQNIRDTVGGPGILQNATVLLKDLGRELDKPEPPSSLEEARNTRKPLPVEVHQPDPGATGTLVQLINPLVAPLTTTGIVVLLVAFFLAQREDLRNRFIRLAGSHDIERTTAALSDAGSRLIRLLTTQVCLNAAFGLVIGSGLALIGVPSAPLWGLMAMLLRFVPYIGAVLCAALPLTLAVAVGPDWTMALWTLALFLFVEPIMGHVIEPMVYGHSTGLSPVAIVVSAVFWTWLWGPLGLLLSTPMTLCLVVVSRHVERLKFIDIMFGDHPALTPEQTIYQRLLSEDSVEITERAVKSFKHASLEDYWDQRMLAALRLAQIDAEDGKLDKDQREAVLQTTRDVCEDLEDIPNGDDKAPADPLDDRSPMAVCMPLGGRLDTAAAIVVAAALRYAGSNARLDDGGDIDRNATLCVCHLQQMTPARMRRLMRSLQKRGWRGDTVTVSLGPHEPADDTANFVRFSSAKELVEAFARKRRETLAPEAEAVTA